MARLQMRRQIVAVVAEPAHVDQVTNSGVLGSLARVPSGHPLLLHEVVADGERVNEVDDLIDALEGRADRREIGQVTLDDLDVSSPSGGAQTRGSTGHAAYD